MLSTILSPLCVLNLFHHLNNLILQLTEAQYTLVTHPMSHVVTTPAQAAWLQSVLLTCTLYCLLNKPDTL